MDFYKNVWKPEAQWKIMLHNKFLSDQLTYINISTENGNFVPTQTGLYMKS
jgi:hypothetical protein